MLYQIQFSFFLNKKKQAARARALSDPSPLRTGSKRLKKKNAKNLAKIMFFRKNFVKISNFLHSKFKNFVLGRSRHPHLRRRPRRQVHPREGSLLQRPHFPRGQAGDWLKKNLANKIFGYLARCDFWSKIGLRFWIFVGYVDFLANFGAKLDFRVQG